MGYTVSDVAHRWVHNLRKKSKDSEFYETDCMRFTENSAYSYSTVICQALDRDKHLFLMIDKSLSNTTAKHIKYVYRAIPSDWTIIETHWDGRNGFDNVSFLGGYGKKFNQEKRMALVSHLLMDLYKEFNRMTFGKTRNTADVNLYPLKAITILNDLYNNDCSLKKWLRTPWDKLPGKNEFFDENVKSKKEVWKRVRTMVKMLIEFNMSTDTKDRSRYGVKFMCSEENWKQKILDAMFGDGEYDKMQTRIAGICKAQATVAKMDVIRSYLFLPKTNENAFIKKESGALDNKMLRKMLKTVDGRKELLRIKHDLVVRQADQKEQLAHTNRQRKSYNRARVFLGISPLHEQELKYGTIGSWDVAWVKKDGKDIYTKGYSYNRIISDYGLPSDTWPEFVYASGYNRDCLDFAGATYDSFCNAPDKRNWRKRFWQKAELCMRRKRGHLLYGFYTKLNGNMNLTPEDHHIMNEFVTRKNRWDADEEKRKRIEAARKQKELQLALEKLEAYKNGGIDGVRHIYWDRLGNIPYNIDLSGSELFFGGNVLLRFGNQYGIVETSKGIRMTFQECHKYWEYINGWHNGQPFFRTEMAGYIVESYKDDILKAGCHEIAFCEMERMYYAMCEKEAAQYSTCAV